MKKLGNKPTIKLRLCFNRSHLNGGWYNGEQHYLGFHGPLATFILHYSIVELCYMWFLRRDSKQYRKAEYGK